MKYIALLFVTVAALTATACSSANESASATHTTFPNENLLLSVEQFASEMLAENTVIIDTRTSDSAFTASRIPGAIYFHSRRDLNDPDAAVEFFMVGPQAFEAMMRELGIHNDSRILLYDEGDNLGSARLFYALEYFGYEGYVALLDGGKKAWVHAEMAVASGTPDEHLMGTFTSRVREDRVCDVRAVMAAAENPNQIVFDVRSADEFDGTDVRAAQGGHIPGAVHLEWREVLQDGDIPFFRSFEEIRDLYASLGITPDKEVIPHCHTNVRGSHAYFTLRLMGYDSVRPYEGSWAEFGNL
ncbi:MAG: sulfurtransferase [Balneolales bacterium]|nr:sulfurtransferase [Balneolales bacterium]